MIAEGIRRTVRNRIECFGGENRFTAAGRGDSSLRFELLLVVARCLTRGAGGVATSDSSSDLPQSLTKVGVFGGGETLLVIEAAAKVRSHERGLSGE